MSEQDADTRSFLLMVLIAAWLTVWGYSVYHLATDAPVVDGAARGLNRTAGFFGWQGVAGMIAFACWGVGWSFPKGSGTRRISVIPIWCAIALAVVVTGMAVLG